MKYLAQTFAYLKKNFWLPIAAMLVPSLAACFLSTPFWEVTFVAAFDYDPYLSASQTFAILFGDSWKYVWPVIIVSVVQVFGAALVMSCIDRHFRTGRLSLRSAWRMINNSIFPIAIGVAIMCAVSVVLRFLLFGLVMLVQAICSSATLPTGAALTVISIIAVGMFVLHVLIITPMLFWAPIMFVYGYRFRDAAATSFKMLSGKSVFIGLFLPMLFCAGIQLLMGLLQVHAAISITVGFFVFLVTNVYTTCFIMVAFYGISELDRRDIEPYRSPLPVVKRPEPEKPSDEKASAENADKKPKEQKPKDQKQKKSAAGAEKSVADGKRVSPRADTNKKEKGSSAESKTKNADSVNTRKPKNGSESEEARDVL